MENSIYLGLSRQMVLRTNMDIIANNVANMNTPGYRGQNLIFNEFLSDPRGADDPLSFVYDPGQYKNTEAGAVQHTGNPLDIYVNGPGFMGVQGPNGEIYYTRAGNFQLAADGTLSTASGEPVADTGGGRITIPEESTEISVDESGFVSDQNGQLGQIMIVEFENPQTLKPYGHNMYQTDSPTLPPTQTRVKQGQLESSNVRPVIEMTRMIETLRSFQSVQQVLQTENERLRGAIQKLTRQN